MRPSIAERRFVVFGATCEVSRSQNARSLRIEYSAINTVAFKSCSGGTLGRPIREYIASNSLSSSARTSSMTLRIRRIG